MTDWKKAWEEEVKWATWYVETMEKRKCSSKGPLLRNAKAILAHDRAYRELEAKLCAGKEAIDIAVTGLAPHVHYSQATFDSGLEPTTAKDNELDSICGLLVGAFNGIPPLLPRATGGEGGGGGEGERNGLRWSDGVGGRMAYASRNGDKAGGEGGGGEREVMGGIGSKQASPPRIARRGKTVAGG